MLNKLKINRSSQLLKLEDFYHTGIRIHMWYYRLTLVGVNILVISAVSVAQKLMCAALKTRCNYDLEGSCIADYSAS